MVDGACDGTAMTIVRASELIAAPVQRVWGVVRDFGAHSAWLEGQPAITLSGGSGTTVGVMRSVIYSNGQRFDEVLTALDDKTYFQQYDIVGKLPLPVYNVYGAIQLHPVTATDVTLVERRLYYDTPLPQDEAQAFALTRIDLLAGSLRLLGQLFRLQH